MSRSATNFFNSCAQFVIVVVFTVTPTAAQYISIETYTDAFGICGGPGHRGCAYLPTCTAPSGNSLRDDKYTGKILCDLPGASLGESNQGSVPTIFQQYVNGQATPGDTIFTSTDLHFGKSTVSDSDHVRHARFLNQFATSGTFWPRGVGFPNEAIHRPSAIVTTGDNAHDGQQSELGAYRLLYEPLITESAITPVFFGLGNHDVGNDCEFNNCAQRMFDYSAGHTVGGANNFDSGSDNYSWNWGGVHYIQLNKWAGDTQLGSGSAGSTHASGLSWLINDLHNNLGISNRPAVIFQHFGVDSFSENGQWWSASDRLAFWNAIQGYNVVGMFTGHIHSTGIFDFYEEGGHLDDFVGGTGGEDPCLNASLAACGGRGHFFAIRFTGNFMDVASLEWVSNVDGSDRSTAPYFTNLSVPVPNTANAGSQGPSFVGGQPGCRKLINSRFIDVSTLVNNVGTTSGGSSPITVTNTSSTTIPGPLALEFTGLSDTDNLTSKSFVDRCSSAASSYNNSNGGNSFMYPNNGYSGSLPPGASLTFTPTFATAAPSSVYLKLVRAGLTKGASPASVEVTGTPANVPAPGTIAVYGPPNTAFKVTNTVNTATKNFVAVTPASGTFNQFGIATLTYTFNAAALLNDKIDATESSNIQITTSNPSDEVDVFLDLHLRVANTITTSLSPSNQLTVGQMAQVTATISYVPVVNQDANGTYLATGVMTLNDITNASSPASLATGYLNSGCDPTNDPNCPQEPDNTVILPKVTLSPGVHTLQVSYSGDSFYAPNTSASFLVSVGSPTVMLLSQPSGLQLNLDGATVKTPSTNYLTLLSTHTIAAPTPQSVTGTRYAFSAWSDEVSTSSRTITVNQTTASYTANFETLYLLTLNVVPAAGGTVTASDVSADSYYPAGAVETITATPNAGYYFSGFTGAITSTANSSSLTLSGPKTVTASFSQKATPAIAWANPAPILFGSALGPLQLNATASVPGTFVYSPAAGVVPPVGDGYTLSVTFTPTNSTGYASVTATAKVDVLPASPATLIITKTLSRDLSNNNIVVQVTISNTGAATATNVVLTAAKIGAVSGNSLPVSVPNIAGNGSQVVTLIFPGSAGISGASSSLTLSGTYSGGTLNYAARIVLP